MNNIYKISFNTSDENIWLGLNGKKMFMDYEENIIEMKDLEGVFQQLLAIMLGYTN